MESYNYRHKEAAQYLGVAPMTLAKWRMSGDSPVYTKVGRIVIYRKQDLDAWLKQNQYSSTSQYVEV